MASTLQFPLAERDYKKAENVLLEGITSNPDNAMLLFQMGVVMQRTSRVDKAVVFLQRAVELDPESKLSDSWAVFATALHALRRFPEAIVAYQRAQIQSPNNAIMFANFAKLLCHSNVNHPSEGMMAVNRALQISPDNADALDAQTVCRKQLMGTDDITVFEAQQN